MDLKMEFTVPTQLITYSAAISSSAKSCNVSLSGLCEGKPVDFKMEFTVPTQLITYSAAISVLCQILQCFSVWSV